MKPIKDFDKVQAPGNIENIPAGAYICDIKSAKEVANRNSNGTHLEILFDVLEGDYKEFFAKDYRSQNREDKFWRGIINQNIPDENSQKYEQQCKFFKRFVNAVEESNSGYHWDWNEAALKGKKIGVVFGEQEKQSQRGTVYTVSYASEMVSVEDVKANKVRIPAKKELQKPTTNSFQFVPLDAPISEDDLPF